jgi:group I intron endonuclease
MEMSGVIYKIVNLVNDKFYVGSTTNKKVRFREHRKQLRGNRHHCKHLQAAWNKYGEEKFAFQVIEVIDNALDLAPAEDRWLKEHFGKPYCYNSGAAAVAPWRGVYGEKHFNFGKAMASSQKDQISQKLKQHYAENYYNHPRVGRTHSEETRAKISAAKLANPVKPWLGKKRSEETKAKVGDAQRGKRKAEGRKVSEAGMAKIRAAAEAGHYSHWTGRSHTEEAKQKLRKQIDATDSQGVVHRYGSLTEVLQTLGLLMPTLNRALKSGKPLSKGPRMGWSFKYVDTPSAN